MLRYIDEWNELTERIGFWIDTDDAYFTLDPELHRVGLVVAQAGVGEGAAGRGQQGRALLHALRHGAVVARARARLQGRGRPVRLRRFPLLDEPDVSLLAWTTMPWTLVPHAAIAVDPEVTYARARHDGDTLDPRRGAGRAGARRGAPRSMERMPGSDLLGLRYEPPFPYIADYGERGHTVLAGDFVSIEDGTGVVHTGAAFGEDDFRLASENGLTIHNPVRPDGTFDERTGPFAGMHVREADAHIVEALRESGRLFRAGEYEHSYPHCWRCDTPLIYYAKPNWYVRTTAVKDQLLAANETINWYPEHIKHGRFGNWLENNVDWALSRERYWGTPLPVWRCEQGHELLRRLAGRDRASAAASRRRTCTGPFIDEVVLTCEECGGEMRRVPDLIDVWWDSGCMPFAQWHAPFENEDSSGSASRRTTSARRSTRRAAGSTRCSRCR